MVFKNGSEYDGEWKGGLENGIGTFTWANKDQYTGSFFEGEIRGNGHLKYHNHDLLEYIGDWENDQKHGQGKLTWENGAEYSGDW